MTSSLRSGARILRKPTFYWDSVILIEWMAPQSRRDPNDLQGIVEVITRVERGEGTIVIGEDPAKKEILLDTMPPEAARRYNEAFRRRKAQYLPYDPAIIRLVSEIRTYYRLRGEKVPTSIDAEHLAYAIHYGVDEFHTLDGGKKGGADLLSLDGNVAGHNLRIRKPPCTQTALF